MPLYKEPLEVSCFQCASKFSVKYVVPQKDYSKKNNWHYWTEKEENKNKYICNKCLKKLYLKNKLEFQKNIPNKRLRRLLRGYINDKTIN